MSHWVSVLCVYICGGVSECAGLRPSVRVHVCVFVCMRNLVCACGGMCIWLPNVCVYMCLCVYCHGNVYVDMPYDRPSPLKCPPAVGLGSLERHLQSLALEQYTPSSISVNPLTLI